MDGWAEESCRDVIPRHRNETWATWLPNSAGIADEPACGPSESLFRRWRQNEQLRSLQS